jgi:hypothetical protein
MLIRCVYPSLIVTREVPVVVEEKKVVTDDAPQAPKEITGADLLRELEEEEVAYLSYHIIISYHIMS